MPCVFQSLLSSGQLICFSYGDGAGAVVGTFYLKPDSLRLGAHVAYAGYVDALVMVQGLVEGPTP